MRFGQYGSCNSWNYGDSRPRLADYLVKAGMNSYHNRLRNFLSQVENLVQPRSFDVIDVYRDCLENLVSPQSRINSYLMHT